MTNGASVKMRIDGSAGNWTGNVPVFKFAKSNAPWRGELSTPGTQSLVPQLNPGGHRARLEV